MNIKIAILSMTLVGCVAFTGHTATNAAVNSGNGAGSKNTVNERNVRKLNATQTNIATQSNLVDVTQKSGKNKANKNTGGTVTTTTGESAAAVGIENAANENSAEISNCGCEQTPSTAANTSNGADSVNNVTVKNKQVINAAQLNNAVQVNNVLVKQNSGNNQANSNTNGDVTVTTGSAATEVGISNLANTNTLVIE